MSVGTEGCGPNPRTYSQAEYAALDAENARLKEERDSFQRVGIRATEERDALSAELAALKAASGEVEVVAWLAVDERTGEREVGSDAFVWEEDCDAHVSECFAVRKEPLMTAAQHQRITAALRGEVERLKRDAKNDAIAYKAAIERQKELRAELDAIRKQDPAWRRRDGVLGCKRFMTQKCYAAQSPTMKANYEPFHCANCATPATAMDGGMVPVKLEVLEAAEHWLQIHSCPGSTEWLVADDIGDAISAHRQASQQEGE